MNAAGFTRIASARGITRAIRVPNLNAQLLLVAENGRKNGRQPDAPISAPADLGARPAPWRRPANRHGRSPYAALSITPFHEFSIAVEPTGLDERARQRAFRANCVRWFHQVSDKNLQPILKLQ